MGCDVGQIFSTGSLHRDHSISYALVCEKELSHMGKNNRNPDLVWEYIFTIGMIVLKKLKTQIASRHQKIIILTSDCFLQIYQTCIRTQCSSLNHHLYASSPLCDCVWWKPLSIIYLNTQGMIICDHTKRTTISLLTIIKHTVIWQPQFVRWNI